MTETNVENEKAQNGAPLSQTAGFSLWKCGQSDADWPLGVRSYEAFEQFRSEYETAHEFGYGGVYGIAGAHTLKGFIVVNIVPEHLLPAGVSAAEIGTYLLPNYRGMGWNLRAKALSLAICFEGYQVDWCLFAVPVSNGRARRAFAKLPWAFEEEAAESGRFSAFTRRKTFETQKECVVYSIHRSALESRESGGALNPNGN
ncbi:GNAT family N-acetyltransferase [Alicyclobacillus tolerans]|uniref:GNAT family N-acetyltransferase n=1 Tax=Alicyclobacillus tolerans TaxID=90970 RepID=UPI001F424471|nr:GNAT family protein [Alicyclobacillus tolerans]MCF8566160.1 GNAT family N-acetyltransferase [Alicyclobacillus tolerans]